MGIYTERPCRGRIGQTKAVWERIHRVKYENQKTYEQGKGRLETGLPHPRNDQALKVPRKDPAKVAVTQAQEWLV